MDLDTTQIIIAIVGLVISSLIGYYGSKWHQIKKFKEVFSQVRVCIDSVDDALKDDKVSEEEFRKVWESCYNRFKQYFEK